MNINGRSLLSSIVIVGALFAAAASTDDNTPQAVDENGSDSGDDTGTKGGSDAPEQFQVGDLVQLGDWQVRVHEVTDPFDSSNEFVSPEEGTRWVAVDVEVTNRSDQPETVSSLLCFELMDGRNRTYDSTFTAESITPPDGEVAPGKSRRGTLVYEVPAGVRRLRLNFKCDLLSSGTATINL